MRVLSPLYMLLCGLFILPMSVCAADADGKDYGCTLTTYMDVSFTTCRFNPARHDIRLMLNDKTGQPFGTFANAKTALHESGETLLFAMNGGMYHADRRPVGLYVENYKQTAALNTNEGPGNFHMLPNGVFLIWQESGNIGAHVMTAAKYRDKMAKEVVRYATQSGPMLVIDGKLHPKFRKSGTSKHIRNGVGMDGQDVVFAISNAPVNFYTFAALFKDKFNINNALYLDGVVSKIYAPGLDRFDLGRPMGPMIVVTTPTPKRGTDEGAGM